MKKVSKEIIEALNFYKENIEMSISKIAKLYSIDRHTLSKYINLNIKNPSLFSKYKNYYYIFEEKEIEAIDEYIKSSANFSDIKRKYGYKHETFKRKLSAMGHSTGRKYSLDVNRDKFENISTAEDAYMLGFILADGYINEDRNFLHIKISERDKDILVKACKYFECSEDNIKTFPHAITSKKQCSLTINSKSIVNNLKKYNLFQRKSVKEVPYYDIDKSLINHYIRGILDGDGYIQKKGNSLGFCGSKEVLEYIKFNLDFIKENKVTTSTVRFDESSNIYRLSYSSKKDFISILKYLYDDCDIYLDRKYDLYKQKLT